MKTLAPILCASLLFSPMAFASAEVDTLSTCLADHTNGRDRKDLARWMFLAISSHPEIRGLSSATAVDRTNTDKAMAALVTRLLTTDCEAQTQKVVALEGHLGMFNAFKSLGELAMRELMSQPEVAASVGGYGKYLDRKKLESAFGAPK